MQGYDPSDAEQKKGYPTQTTPIMPSGGYPPATSFAPATMLSQPIQPQHISMADDEPIVKGLDFNTESIRKGFIRKVYSILSVILSTHFANGK